MHDDCFVTHSDWSRSDLEDQLGLVPDDGFGLGLDDPDELDRQEQRRERRAERREERERMQRAEERMQRAEERMQRAEERMQRAEERMQRAEEREARWRAGQSAARKMLRRLGPKTEAQQARDPAAASWRRKLEARLAFDPEIPTSMRGPLRRFFLAVIGLDRSSPSSDLEWLACFAESL